MSEPKNRKTVAKPGEKAKAGQQRDSELDEELDETFPASDPPSVTQPKAPRPKRPKG